MPFQKGQPKPPGSGRVAGKLPKIKQEALTAQQILADLGHDPISAMAEIARGNVPCGVCLGVGKTKFQPATRRCKPCMGSGMGLGAPCKACKGTGEIKVDLKERTCQSCYGSRRENVSPELRGKMNAELAKYAHPQLKAVEHTGAGGGPIEGKIEVVFVKP